MAEVKMPKKKKTEAIVDDKTDAALDRVFDNVTEKPKTYGVVNCDKLNIRVKPNGSIKFVVDKGTRVEILEYSDSEWMKILVNNTNAYCMSKFITKG